MEKQNRKNVELFDKLEKEYYSSLLVDERVSLDLAVPQKPFDNTPYTFGSIVRYIGEVNGYQQTLVGVVWGISPVTQHPFPAYSLKITPSVSDIESVNVQEWHDATPTSLSIAIMAYQYYEGKPGLQDKFYVKDMLDSIVRKCDSLDATSYFWFNHDSATKAKKRINAGTKGDVVIFLSRPSNKKEPILRIGLIDRDWHSAHTNLMPLRVITDWNDHEGVAQLYTPTLQDVVAYYPTQGTLMAYKGSEPFSAVSGVEWRGAAHTGCTGTQEPSAVNVPLLLQQELTQVGYPLGSLVLLPATRADQPSYDVGVVFEFTNDFEVDAEEKDEPVLKLWVSVNGAIRLIPSTNILTSMNPTPMSVYYAGLIWHNVKPKADFARFRDAVCSPENTRYAVGDVVLVDLSDSYSLQERLGFGVWTQITRVVEPGGSEELSYRVCIEGQLFSIDSSSILSHIACSYTRGWPEKQEPADEEEDTGPEDIELDFSSLVGVGGAIQRGRMLLFSTGQSGNNEDLYLGLTLYFCTTKDSLDEETEGRWKILTMQGIHYIYPSQVMHIFDENSIAMVASALEMRSDEFTCRRSDLSTWSSALAELPTEKEDFGIGDVVLGMKVSDEGEPELAFGSVLAYMSRPNNQSYLFLSTGTSSITMKITGIRAYWSALNEGASELMRRFIDQAHR